MDEWMEGRVDEWINEWMDNDEWIHRWMMSGWVVLDGYIGG